MNKTKSGVAMVCLGILGLANVSQAEDVYADTQVGTEENPIVLKSVKLSTDEVIKTPSREDKISEIQEEVTVAAMQQLGKAYVWGATGPNAFDCSGFTQYVYSTSAEINLPRYTGHQVNVGEYVPKSELQKGDVLFFNTYEQYGHTGIYVGDGQFIHASSGQGRIVISNLNESYWTNTYATAKRVIDV